MAVRRLNSQTVTGTGSTTVTVNYPVAPTPGNLLIAVACSDNGTTIAGWTTGGTAGNSVRAAILYWKIAGSSEPTAVTITDAGATSIVFGVLEYFVSSSTGIAVDKVDGNGASSVAATVTTGSITIPEYELVFTCVASTSTSVVSSFSNGFSNIVSASNGTSYGLSIADRFASGATSTTGTFTVNASSSALILSFKGVAVNEPGNTGKYVSVGDGMSRSEVAN